MLVNILGNPVEVFLDTNGQPLNGGSIYIGQPNTDPTNPANQITVYQDSGLSIPLQQPLKTSNGQPILNGSQIPAYLGLGVTAYSLAVVNAGGVVVMSLPSVAPFSLGGTAGGNMVLKEFISDILPNPGGLPTFTAGTTSSLPLSTNPGAGSNVFVDFDAAPQHYPDDFAVSGTNLNFTSPIPVGVQKVFTRVGITTAVGTPGTGTVTDSSVAAGSNLYIRNNDLIFIEDGGGVKADGVTDDSAAMAAKFTSAAGKEIFFKGATYKLGSNVVAPAGSRAHFQTGVTFTGAGTLQNVAVEYETGQATATAGSVMKIDRLWETTGTGYSAINLASIWSTATYAGYARSKTFVSADGGINSPCTTDLNYAVNNGSPSDVCAGIDASILTSTGANGTVFGRNTIAGTYAGVTNAKVVGSEIDVEYTAGTTSAGTGGGQYLNVFNAVNVGPVMQSGAISGSWTNGILMSGIAASGSAFAAGSGLSCAAGLNLGNGAYSLCAVALGNGVSQGVYYGASGGGQAAIVYADASNNLNIAPSSALQVLGPNTTEGNTLMAIKDSGGIAPLQVYVARGSGPNAAAAAMKVNGQSSTSRSINAGGTINASGADYAEYEFKRDDCGVFAKGQIVGFDADGKLTDKFALAIRFGVKSTAPNLVGGDDWHKPAGDAPTAPVPPDAAPAEPVKNDHTRLYTKYQEQIDAEHEEAMQAWQTKVDARAAAIKQYEAALGAFNIAYAAWEAKLEAVRQKVDRIAYCGKVPVNVTGAKPGQYLVPVASGDGIGGQLVDAPTFDQYRIAIGQVSRIREDGRAEVVVKPI